MERISGKHINQHVLGESYQAYVPEKLPPQPGLQLDALAPLLERATAALSALNTITQVIPNISLFIYMYVRKEALLSSQIEGTQSSFSDLILFENDQKPMVSLEDVEEVSNYVQAIQHGLDRLQGGFPLSLRLLKEIHEILLKGSRGATKLPGQIRTSQNWIGGTRPGNALFVPPPAEHVMDLMGDLESFLHSNELPVLVKAGLAHLQFETIHPFLDGNGRLGRLLITLLLCEGGLLDAPVLYLSLYLKQNYDHYFRLLQEVRFHGTWEAWLEFFLQGVETSSKQAMQTATSINALFEKDLAIIQGLGRIRFSCEEVFHLTKKLPQVSVPVLVEKLSMSAPTARAAVEKMVEAGILEETTGKQRDRIYCYKAYLSILELGTTPLDLG